MLEEQDVNSPFGKPEESPQKGKVKVRLICPLYEVMAMEADKVLLPAVDGDILILPERAPIFIALRAGRMVIYNEGEKPVNYLISSGICEVRRNLCPVLAWGGREDKIDPEVIAAQLADAEKSIGEISSDLRKHEVASRIVFFKKVLEELHYQPAGDMKKTKGRGSFNPYQLKDKK